MYGGVDDGEYVGVYDEVEDGADIIPGNGIIPAGDCSDDGNWIISADVVVVAGAGGGGGGSAGRLPPDVEELSV